MEASLEQMTEIVVALLTHKYIENNNRKTDQVFDEETKQVIQKYIVKK